VRKGEWRGDVENGIAGGDPTRDEGVYKPGARITPFRVLVFRITGFRGCGKSRNSFMPTGVAFFENGVSGLSL
jgi:hypothetical protein